MSKSIITVNELLAALARILDKKTIRIPSTRKLSVRAVEDEANLGDGSAYYYPEVVRKIKDTIKAEKNRSSDLTNEKSLEKKLRAERSIKNKYRAKLTILADRMQLMAKEHNELYQQLIMYKEKAEELEARLSLLEK